MTTFSNKINSRKLQLESLENREMLSVNPLGNSDDTAVLVIAASATSNAGDVAWLNNFPRFPYEFKQRYRNVGK